MYLQKWKCIQKRGDLVKKYMASVRSKHERPYAQKNICIYIKHIKMFQVTPFPSIGLGRRTTTTSSIFASTLSNHVPLGIPTGLLSSVLNPHTLLHMSIPSQYATPTSLLTCSFVLLSFMEIPHIILMLLLSTYPSSPISHLSAKLFHCWCHNY